MMHRRLALLIALMALAALACNLPLVNPAAPAIDTAPQPATPAPEDQPTSDDPTPTTSPPTPTDVPTATLTPSPSPTPFGCGPQPPDDYTRIEFPDSIVLSQRTVSMLEYAQTLYGGSHDFLAALTQGSYSAGLDASFGTHDGGGAVDLSVRSQTDRSVLYDELDALILALRQAGFAAWVRDVGELYENSPIHIHAISVGDADLSDAAARQLTGPEGYFRGFNGLPVDPPAPDTWGEPIVCPWMVDLGYADLRTGDN